MTDHKSRLEELQKTLVKARSLPLRSFRTENGYQPVLGSGDPDAAVVFVGEAPGRKEAESGQPFVGSAGRILDSLFDAANLDRGTVYITNIVNDRPPKNRDPKPEEIARYKRFTLSVLDIIRPRVVATLGRISQQTLMEEFGLSDQHDVIGAIHGRVYRAKARFGDIVYIPLYHPAAAIYNQKLKPVMVTDMKTVTREISRPV